MGLPLPLSGSTGSNRWQTNTVNEYLLQYLLVDYPRLQLTEKKTSKSFWSKRKNFSPPPPCSVSGYGPGDRGGELEFF